MTATQKLEAYLKPAILGIPGFQYCEFSDGENMDRFSEDTVRKQVYPAAFIIASEYSLENNGTGHMMAKFKPIIYVLKKIVETKNPNPFHDEDTAFVYTEQLLTEIYIKLRHDNHSMTVDFPAQSPWKPQKIKSVTLDNALGWQVSTEISIPVYDIYC